MPEHIQYEDDDLFNPETHHEGSDVPLKPLWWALALFVIFAAITHIVLYFMYHGMLKAEKARMDPPQTAVPRPANADIPQNQPLLQPFPVSGAAPDESTSVTNLQAMRAAEDRVLKNYGWVDKEHGVVHIPIDQAKDMLAMKIASEGQGLGTSTSSPAPPVTPAAVPTDTTAAPAPAPATTTEGAH